MSKSINIECDSATQVNIDSLLEFQGNLKDLSAKNYQRLKKQIIENGFSEPISVWENQNKLYILNGHQRLRTLRTMREEGFTIPKIPINKVQARDIKQAKQKVLALTSQYGEITNDGFYEFLHESNLDFNAIKDDLRFPEIDFDKFEAEYFKDEAREAIEDNIPEIDESKIVCRLGDLWTLGNHRLLCGDCTIEENVNKLMNGEKADMVFTDPPYGVSYNGGVFTERKEIKGDGDASLYDPCCKMAFKHSKENASLYLWLAATKTYIAAAAAAAAAAGYEIRCEIIWNKNNAQFGALSSQYKQKHEPCFYCYKKGKTVNWDGPTNEVTVWDIDRSSKNEFHPTQKPIALAERAITNHKVDTVLDMFLGSGSTLIACEKLNKKGYGTELDPHFCDVILQRWSDYTGKDPVREDGKKFSELKAALNG